MNLEKYRAQQLADKIRQMKVMNLSPEEIQKSFTGEELNMIEKSMIHKYIRKEGDRYIYNEPEKKSKVNEKDPWYVQQGEAKKEKAEHNKHIADEFKNQLESELKNRPNNESTKVEVTESGQYNGSYYVDFNYKHPNNPSKDIRLGVRVNKDGSVNKLVAGAMYDMEGENIGEAVKNYLDYVDKVPTNRL